MSLSCSGKQKEQFENPFEILAQLEFEITLKNHAQRNIGGKIEKNHKSLGRDLKNQFIPNKKHFSLVHDGIRNFLEGGPEDLFLTSPPTTISELKRKTRAVTFFKRGVGGLSFLLIL